MKKMGHDCERSCHQKSFGSKPLIQHTYLAYWCTKQAVTSGVPTFTRNNEQENQPRQMNEMGRRCLWYYGAICSRFRFKRPRFNETGKKRDQVYYIYRRRRKARNLVPKVSAIAWALRKLVTSALLLTMIYRVI